MDISEKHSYLTLFHTDVDLYQLGLYDTIEAIMLEWKSSTRVSPIWPLDKVLPSDKNLLDYSNIAVLGPIDPKIFELELSQKLNFKSRIWCSLGIMNLIVAYEDKAASKVLIEWIKSTDCSMELWELDDNKRIVEKNFFQSSKNTLQNEWRIKLSELVKEQTSPNITLALSEFAPLLASTLSRLEIYNYRLAESHTELIDYVSEAIQKSKINNGDSDSIAAAIITTLNAGLSRFSSQSLSGVIPITSTESHFWVHSLFGIGIAGVGLSNLVQFISEKIGNAFIPNKIQCLLDKKNSVPIFNDLHSDDNLWTENHLDNIEYNETYTTSPDITFFSGRDGFKAHLTNLSVPLTAVFSCNSEKWTLLTISHEISHKILKAVLSLIFPLDGKSDEAIITKEEAINLYNQYNNNSKEPENWLDSLRLWLWESVNQISATDSYLSSKNEDSDGYLTNIELLDSIDSWYGEVEEIVVHVFDFLYFYRSEDERYLKEIWMTWSVIPNISSRVPEYVLRSICSVLSKNLHRELEVAIEVSVERVRTGLTTLNQNEPTMPYIIEAIEYIDESSNTGDLRELILARYQLVRFVKTFLYSENTVADLWEETRTKGGKTQKKRYEKKPLELDNIDMDNPLLFLETYSTDKKSNEARSAWIYYNLAFHVRSKK
jgi:hypothetical protein